MNRVKNLDKLAEDIYIKKKPLELQMPYISLVEHNVIDSDYFYRDLEMFRPDLDESID